MARSVLFVSITLNKNGLATQDYLLYVYTHIHTHTHTHAHTHTHTHTHTHMLYC